MIQVNMANIVTIALAGALGYALALGLQMMWSNVQKNGSAAS